MPMMPGLHRPAGSRSRVEQKREQDRRRGSARERGYTTRWDREALAFRRAHPFCLGCEAVGVVKATEVVDHVVPHRGDAALFWDASNRQPSCAWHHDVVKQRLEMMFDGGEIGEADLRLDSPAAVDLARRLDPGLGR